MPQTVRKRVIYHGRVQGVGFRATTQSIASRYSVTGFVRNLPDGTVEVVVDGPFAEVQSFLAAVADRFSRQVARADVEPLHGGEPMARFSVRR